MRPPSQLQLRTMTVSAMQQEKCRPPINFNLRAAVSFNFISTAALPPPPPASTGALLAVSRSISLILRPARRLPRLLHMQRSSRICAYRGLNGLISGRYAAPRHLDPSGRCFGPDTSNFNSRLGISRGRGSSRVENITIISSSRSRSALAIVQCKLKAMPIYTSLTAPKKTLLLLLLLSLHQL